MVTRNQVIAIRNAARALEVVLRQDDNAPGAQMIIDEMLKVIEQVVDKYPKAAVILLERSASFMVDLPALCSVKQVDDALEPIGGLKALTPDNMEKLWSPR